MIKILIVDDEEVKAAYLSEICQSYLCNVEIMFAPRLAAAMLNLNKQYDLVLCDRLLGDGFGEQFVDQYRARWPQSKVVFYSADEDSCANAIGVKCHSFDAVKGEILAFKESTKEHVFEVGTMQTEQQSERQHKPEYQKGVDVKSYMPIIVVGITLGISGLIGFTRVSAKADSTANRVSEHCVNQQKNEDELVKVLTDFACATTELRTEVKNLRGTVDKLQDEIRSR